MRKIDFIVQTFMIMLAPIFLLAGIIGNPGMPLTELLYAQLFIGPWQFFGSLITWIKNLKQPSSLFKSLISIHLTASTIYLFLTLLLIDFISDGFFHIWITVIPWLLALFYYVLSYLRIKRYHK